MAISSIMIKEEKFLQFWPINQILIKCIKP